MKIQLDDAYKAGLQGLAPSEPNKHAPTIIMVEMVMS